MIRIGFGCDTHRLEPGNDLWLGGILVPGNMGAIGHSDGDALIHAIIDSLLGAAGLRDIGTQFPDTSETYRDIDSKILLRKAYGMVREKGFAIVNIDATVVIQQPRLAPHIPEMIQTLAGVLETDPGRISVKAKTGEHLGFIGREEGLSTFAVALLETETT